MRRSKFIKMLASGALLATAVSLTPTGASANPPAGGSPRVASLRVTIQTGADDLRSNSQAFAILEYTTEAGVRRNTSAGLNNASSWGDWSTNTVEFSLPADVQLGGLDEFAIQFNSGQSGPFDTGDNWNMQSITVTGILADESEVVLVQDAGNPLHRFKSDNNTRWSEAL